MHGLDASPRKVVKLQPGIPVIRLLINLREDNNVQCYSCTSVNRHWFSFYDLSVRKNISGKFE